MKPTGEQVDLEWGPYRATITEVGATLRRLSCADRPLITGFDADEPMPEFNGALLAPWPNRIADGRYEFDGRSHQLPVSEPARGTALHGLVAWQAWTIRSADGRSVQLGTVLHPQRGYPFLLSLYARYALDTDGLRIEIRARNDGGADAPYGVSMHPWFVADPGPVDDWTLTLPAGQIVTTDDRLLPTGTRTVSGELDFRGGRTLGRTPLDHAFTGIDFEHDLAHARLVSPAGTGVEISWDRSCRWLQVCTGDEAGPNLNRRAVAIEPMTCPPNAFRSGQGLIRLRPGQSHAVTWQVTALG